MNASAPARLPTPHSERLKALLAIWHQLAEGRVGPRREQITPTVLRGHTASTFMIDVVDGGADFRFRFAGDKIIQFMGRRMAGDLLTTYRGSPFFENMYRLYRSAVMDREAVSAGPVPASLEGREFYEIEVLVMPLSEDGVEISALFGAIDIGGPTQPAVTRSKSP